MEKKIVYTQIEGETDIRVVKMNKENDILIRRTTERQEENVRGEDEIPTIVSREVELRVHEFVRPDGRVYYIAGETQENRHNAADYAESK